MKSTVRSELHALFVIIRGFALMLGGLWLFTQGIWLLWALGGS